MKTLIASMAAGAAVLGALAVSPNPPTGRVALAWDYPWACPDSFNVYCSTNLATPMTNWVVLTNVICPITGTNVDAATGCTNYVRQLVTGVVVQIQPGAAMFFSCTASNAAGESPFSNAAGFPGLSAAGGSMGVSRAP